jgi:hypothetical protein
MSRSSGLSTCLIACAVTLVVGSALYLRAAVLQHEFKERYANWHAPIQDFRGVLGGTTELEFEFWVFGLAAIVVLGVGIGLGVVCLYRMPGRVSNDRTLKSDTNP